MSKERIDRITNTSISRKNPEKAGNLKIDIWHVDVHPSREALITWRYSDGTIETIIFHGNGGTRFKNKSKRWTNWFSYGDHTTTIVKHHGLRKQYKFEKLNRESGRNTWSFETKSGGVTSVEISNPRENWGGLIRVDLSWIPAKSRPVVQPVVQVQSGPSPATLAAIAEAERLLQELENKIQNAERVVNDQENQIRKNQVSISNLNKENDRLIIKRDETRGEVSTSTNQLNNILSQINSAKNDKRSAEEEKRRAIERKNVEQAAYQDAKRSREEADRRRTAAEEAERKAVLAKNEAQKVLNYYSKAREAEKKALYSVIDNLNFKKDEAERLKKEAFEKRDAAIKDLSEKENYLSNVKNEISKSKEEFDVLKKSLENINSNILGRQVLLRSVNDEFKDLNDKKEEALVLQREAEQAKLAAESELEEAQKRKNAAVAASTLAHVAMNKALEKQTEVEASTGARKIDLEKELERLRKVQADAEKVAKEALEKESNAKSSTEAAEEFLQALEMEKKASQAALAAIKKENDEQNKKSLEIIQNTDDLKKEAAALRNILDKQDKDYKSILDKIKVAEGERIKLENAKALAEVSIREMEKKRSELNNSTESEKARLRKELDELETKLKKARDDELEAASNFALASSKIPEDVDLTIRALGIAEAEIENQEKTNDLLAKSMSESSDESTGTNWFMISIGLLLFVILIFVFK